LSSLNSAQVQRISDDISNEALSIGKAVRSVPAGSAIDIDLIRDKVMGMIHTSNVKPGMVLAGSVRDVNGRLLLSEGKTIKPDHLRIFKMWGVSEVPVQGPGDGSEEVEANHFDPEIMRKAEDHCQKLFLHAGNEHPVLEEIFQLSLRHHCLNPPQEFRSVVCRDEDLSPGATGVEPVDILSQLGHCNLVLPEIPSIVYELNEAIANPMSSSEHIAEVVNRSPSLTAVLLRIVNSSFYGLPSKVDKVSLAVTLIGTREISSLALGISILSMFKNIPRHIIDMYSFLRHSLACGITARILAAQMNLHQTEQLFVSGLLHDLGRLLLYIYFPKESVAVLNKAAASGQLLYVEEEAFLGCDHCDIGKFLTNQWKLPLLLENNVAYHHWPSRSPEPVFASVIHLADILVHAVGYGSTGEFYVPPLDEQAWMELKLSPSCFDSVVKQALHQIEALETLLED
jgi:HD-like signal output (HDOD) protein